MHSEVAPGEPAQATGLDAHWLRIADLRPRLREHVRIHTHRYRGRDWFVLHDPMGGRFHRVDVRARRVIDAMDGRRTVREIRTLLEGFDPNSPLRKEELCALFNLLHGSDLLRWDVPPDIGELHGRFLHARAQRNSGRLRTPFVMRIPLFDPDRLLRFLAQRCRGLFSPAGAAIWLAVIIAGLLSALASQDELLLYWSERALAPHRIALLGIVFVMIKAVHELAHGIATRHWGGEVHETGLMLLVFLPVPYVDASAATAFVEKRRRMLVGAAGILAELFIAALAALLWSVLETGLLRDAALAAMLVGGVSTVFFNGNPLLRFDGYYVLSDWIEIPNLAARSNRYYGYLLRRYLCGDAHAVSPVCAAGERRWFLVFGCASFFYRLFITFSIALYVSGKFLVVGVIAALWGICGQLLFPAIRGLHSLFASSLPVSRRGRAATVMVALSAAAMAILAWLPIPLSTHAQGIVWLPDDAHARAGASGFVQQVFHLDGDFVARGDSLIQLKDPMLDARIAALEWELQELEARGDASILGDRTERSMHAEAIARSAADLEQVRAQREQLLLRSPVSGRLVLPLAQDLQGRFVERGETLAYVVAENPTTVRVALREQSIARLQDAKAAVSIRLAATPDKAFSASIQREVPAATERLPSAALGTRGGGDIAVDPSHADGRQALEQLFEVELQLDTAVRAALPGMRVHVRFRHAPEPAAVRLKGALRRLFLRQLNL